MEAELAQLRFGDGVRRFVAVLGELAHGPQVGVLGACAETGELEVLAHAFAQGRRPGRGHE